MTTLLQLLNNFPVPGIRIVQTDGTNQLYFYNGIVWRYVVSRENMEEPLDNWSENYCYTELPYEAAKAIGVAQKDYKFRQLFKVTPGTILKAWGIEPCDYPKPSQVIADKIYEYTQWSCDRLQYATDNWEYHAHFRDWIYRILAAFNPRPAKKDTAQVAYFESHDRFKMDKRTFTKPGRFLRKVYPLATDDQCADFAVWWKDTFAPVELIVKTGESREEFKHAYTHTQSRSNDYAKREIGGIPIKSLACSCMRDSFSDQKAHPSEAYASGQFSIVWAEDQEGRIAARCTVWHSKRRGIVPGPIYTLFDDATDTVYAKLVEMGHKEGEFKADWTGANLAAINLRFDEYTMPYIDYNPYLDFDGESFTISSHGDISCRETKGYVEATVEPEYTCDCCGDSVDEENLCYDEDAGENLCQSCYRSRFTTCDCCGESVRETHEVRVREHQTEQYCQSCLEDDTVYSEFSSEYVLSSEATWIECVEDYIADWDVNDHYFQSDVDCEYYPLAEKVELPNGEVCTIKQAEESGDWDVTKERVLKSGMTNRDGSEQWEELITIKLKPWLELNEHGRVINRQIDLPFAA